VISACIRSHILQRENLQNGVLQICRNHFTLPSSSDFSYHGARHAITAFWTNANIYTGLKNAELQKLRLSGAYREKFIRDTFLDRHMPSTLTALSESEKKDAAQEFLNVVLSGHSTMTEDAKLLQQIF